ncbi:MAG: hypothetical protein HC794_01545, partial [Nitrospiraceae bacterium]|nr:hypothetical protein [Nitrospiraceae bacterium]
RVQLLRIAADDHLLLVTMHHIISDGWSIDVMLREIAALYRGETLPELAIQYADFAAWQRDWLQGELLESQLAYWRDRSPIVATLLYQRELRDPQALAAFLSSDYKSGFHDPFLMKDMQPAAQRIATLQQSSRGRI